MEGAATRIVRISKCSPLHPNAVVAGCRCQAGWVLIAGSRLGCHSVQSHVPTRRPTSMKIFICTCIVPIGTECFWLRNLANLNSSSGASWCELMSCLNTSRSHNAATRKPSHFECVHHFSTVELHPRIRSSAA
jgi:hypothetical protein